MVPQDYVNHIAQAIPGARLVSLKGCGRFTYMESPAVFHQLIDEFMAAA